MLGEPEQRLEQRKGSRGKVLGDMATGQDLKDGHELQSKGSWEKTSGSRQAWAKALWQDGHGNTSLWRLGPSQKIGLKDSEVLDSWRPLWGFGFYLESPGKSWRV